MSFLLRAQIVFLFGMGICRPVLSADATSQTWIKNTIEQTCVECHNDENAEGGLDLSSLAFELEDSSLRSRWVQIFDRVEQREMPPAGEEFPDAQRNRFVSVLRAAIHKADLDEVISFGRGPIRRLNRDEYQQNLRDILALPTLDIRDMLPEDRESHLFNKTTEALDISRVQLNAYLNAAETALLTAIASGVEPPPMTDYVATGGSLFSVRETFGNRQAMFFAKNSKHVGGEMLNKLPDDPQVEMALFRSAHWPYFGYPKGFVAKLPGEYRVRFSARAVVQLPGFELKPASKTIPMTFRARKPSGPDVSGDVRATGGIIDVRPAGDDHANRYETTVHLLANETFEYSLLGLPVPLARNVNNGPPTYRYPPFPEGGQPGVAFRSLEVKGPISSSQWPPSSHHVLFANLPIREVEDDLPVEVVSLQPRKDAARLLRRFIRGASRKPIPEDSVAKFEALVFSRLDGGKSFASAMLTGYKAFLCSGHMLYLQEPVGDEGHYAIASRLSHFLANTRPDSELMKLAAAGKLRDVDIVSAETNRLIDRESFDYFVNNFTDYWLNLRHIHRDEPDVRLYPEYRFDNYLVDSMTGETRSFFTTMVRENLPATSLVKANFVCVNDRLAKHYRLAPIQGSSMRKVELAAGSPYGGLLTQAAILKVTSDGSGTSPVKRGAWIMERLLGQPPPPPPESVPAVEPDIRGATTIRQLLALHTKSDSCANCHARFDPVGFGLENFDILGRWRTRYRGLGDGDEVTGIDRAGHDFTYALTSSINAGGKLLDGRRFQDIHELKNLLAANPRQLARNLLNQFTVYATGTPVRFSDRSEIEQLLDACAGDGYRVRDLLHVFIQSKIFLGRAEAS
ncbi:MAG: hypothetical protein ACI9G1_003554 [Pirellulaceae bacterium]|jgi:hypothetical protein